VAFSVLPKAELCFAILFLCFYQLPFRFSDIQML